MCECVYYNTISLMSAYNDLSSHCDTTLDVKSNRKMLQLLLKHRGFTLIDQCENGKEAVDCVSAKGNDYYDLIFLDNLMPTMVSLSIDHPSIIIISVLSAL